MKLDRGQQPAEEAASAQLAGVVAEASLKLACLCNDLLQVYSNRNILCNDHACLCSSYRYIGTVHLNRLLLFSSHAACYNVLPPLPLGRLGVLPGDFSYHSSK